MRISKIKLLNIIEEALEECGEPMTHDPVGLEDAIDTLDQNVEPMKVGHGGTAKMARGHLYHISNRSQSLHDRLTDEDELPEWVQSKLAVAEELINSVYDHLDYKIHQRGSDDVEEISFTGDVGSLSGDEAFGVGYTAGKEGL